MKREKKEICLKVIRDMEDVIDLDIESVSTLLHFTTEELIDQDISGTFFTENVDLDMIDMVYEISKELQRIKQTLTGCCCTLYDQVVH